MLPRIKRTAVSFFAMVAAFWVYRLVAEPLIDPPLAEKRVLHAKPASTSLVQQQHRLRDYLRFFPEGAWERGNPIMLESDDGTAKLLLQEYQIDGRLLELRPCTMIFLPDGELEGPASRRRVVIMQAEKTILEFDEPVDFARLQMDKLKGMSLPGPITIHSGPTRPEAGDDLHVVTRDVKMVGNKIFTPPDVEVQFRFGASYGSGREMHIELATAEAAASHRTGPNIGGIQDFRLLRDVQMHLQPGSSGILPGDDQRKGDNARRNVPQPPVDVRCIGPFAFDLVDYVARFHDDVLVLRANPVGPADQLTCGLLSVFFAEREPTPPPNTPSGNLPRLEPRRIEARGNPVTVNAPSNAVYATGERMEYDIRTGRIELDAQQGPKPVQLRVRETNRAEARSLSYEPAPRGQLIGKLSSIGPGWLQATPTEGAADQVVVRWSRKLELRPHEDNHLLSVVGDAHVSYTDQGQLEADEIHLWLIELAEDAARDSPASRPRDNRNNEFGSLTRQIQARILPDRLWANGLVRIASPQISGEVGQLKTWFRPVAANARRNSSDNRTYRSRDDATPPMRSQEPREHYEIYGGVLETEMVLKGSAAELEYALIKNNVQFKETPSPAAPGGSRGLNNTQRLSVSGDQLEVQHANASKTKVTVLGQPAEVAAGGMTMIGSSVQLDRGANRLWIDGQGRMTIVQNQPPQSPSAAAMPVADQRLVANRQPTLWSNRGPVEIVWQKGMDFDGRTARFEQNVVATQTTPEARQQVRTQRLDVTLRGQVDFNARQQPQPPEVEWIACRGKAELENRTFKQTQPTAIDQMVVLDLSVNQITGEVKSHGPGQAWSWRIGSGPSFAARPISATRSVSSEPTPEGRESLESENRLSYFDVEFQNGITGNILEGHRKLTFHDQVRGLYGPAPQWEVRLTDERPEPGKMTMSCDELTVSQIAPAPDGSTPLEVEAEGNAHIDGMGDTGELFNAVGQQIHYTEAKNVLTLKGDGRNFAQLHRQVRIGAPPSNTTANEFMFFISDQRVQEIKIKGGQNLDFSDLGTVGR